MTAAARGGPDPGLVAAAQRGDERALDALVAQSLPLVYAITGRALGGGPDVDDAVQETLLQVVRHLCDLRAADAYRSWLVAIAIRQIRVTQEHQRSARARHGVLAEVDDVVDPLLDVGDEAVLHVRLAGERRELTEAVAWLDPDDRTLLALWWLEETGHLDRPALVASLRLSDRHVAVRLQRLREHLDTARSVVRAVREQDRCARLSSVLRGWDGRPSGLWRKRVWRHVRMCSSCGGRSRDFLRVEALLLGIPLLTVPAAVGEHIIATVLGHPAAPAATTALAAIPKTAAITTVRHRAGAARGWFHSPAHLPGLVPTATAGVVAAAVTVSVLILAPTRPDRPTASLRTLPATPTVTVQSPVPTPSPTPTATASTPTPTATKAAVHAVTTSKKGVCAWSFTGVDTALVASGASWYYTWAADHPGIHRPGFVPMIWGAGSATRANLAAATKAGPYLLGFNEPDLAAQSNLTVQAALDLWPRVQAAGRIVGSPAVATGGDVPGGWLDRFMTGAAQRDYRVDFIALHWYGGDFDGTRATAQLRDYLQKVYARYHKPIWLTEYALIDFSHGTRYPDAAQQRNFILHSVSMLQSLPYVQRYAWFALQHSATSPTGLYDSGARPTTWGSAFSLAGRS